LRCVAEIDPEKFSVKAGFNHGIKRLYVRPCARGRGLGKRIAKQLIREAVHLGYAIMVLDTLERLEAATQLYRSLGFMSAEPYHDNPLSGIVYMKLSLRNPPKQIIR
jgi:putative acetyltransferase